jgi:signal transduction histidine kinase
MVCGLAMVLVMMIGLLLSATYNHLAYRHIVRDLEYAFDQAPHKPELVAAMVKLEVPLPGAIREGAPGRRKRIEVPKFRHGFDYPAFCRALDEARAEANQFLYRTNKLPWSPKFEQSKQKILEMAADIDVQLDQLQNDLNRIPDPASDAAVLPMIKATVDSLQRQAQQIPDLPRGIKDTLDEAREVFGRGFWFVIGSGAVAVAFFLGLIVYGYVWVFSPLRKLHRGALRVAQGDFNYRLKFTRQDEMKELADAFNSMTSRFQEIACDLDRQVCERSKQLVRSERLAGIGFLAAGVAHEINNPLSAIAMASESLTDRLIHPIEGAEEENAEVARQYLQMIQREAFRCQQITRKLLDFARGSGDTRSRLDLTSIVNDVLAVVQHISRYGDRKVRFRRSRPCHVEINGPEIQQVVMNLVSNGLEAMEAGGTLTIDITEQTDHVTLTVSDEGCGMSPEVIENLFEPFFTQRRDGRGTGLGLSISHRIVGDHGGTIEAASEGLGRGSTFRVRLPRRCAKREVAA